MILLLLFIKDRENVFAMWREAAGAAGHSDLCAHWHDALSIRNISQRSSIPTQEQPRCCSTQDPAMILVYLCIRNPEDRKYMRWLHCSVLCSEHLFWQPMEIRQNWQFCHRHCFWGMVAAVALVVYTLQPAYLMKKYTTLLTSDGVCYRRSGIDSAAGSMEDPSCCGWGAILALAVIILLGTILAFYCYLTGVQMVGATNASMLACVEPVAATVISVLWLKVEFQMIRPDWICICIIHRVYCIIKPEKGPKS